MQNFELVEDIIIIAKQSERLEMRLTGKPIFRGEK
jgi:hypothetical protein